MADLMESNRKNWRYNLVWDKVLPGGFLNASRQPMRRHEEIVVFYKKQPTYNPQKVPGKRNHSVGKTEGKKKGNNRNYNDYVHKDNAEELGDMKHPTSIVAIPKPHASVATHPTEKPVKLCEWLIKTYTNEGDLVLDNCMGTGSTGIACVNIGRRFVGIEIDTGYFNTAQQRIEEAEQVMKSNF